MDYFIYLSIHSLTHQVTVFDFSTILERTEKRVLYDLLGAGPKTVDELRSIARRLRIKYQNQLERKIQRAKQKNEGQNVTTGRDGSGDDSGGDNSKFTVPPLQIQGVMDKASNMAGGLFAKVKSAKFRTSFTSNNSRFDEETESRVTTATIVDLPPLNDIPTAATTSSTIKPAATTTATNRNVSGNDSTTSSTGTDDWEGTDIAPATDAISNFSIGDDEEEDADLLL